MSPPGRYVSPLARITSRMRKLGANIHIDRLSQKLCQTPPAYEEHALRAGAATMTPRLPQRAFFKLPRKLVTFNTTARLYSTDPVSKRKQAARSPPRTTLAACLRATRQHPAFGETPPGLPSMTPQQDGGQHTSTKQAQNRFGNGFGPKPFQNSHVARQANIRPNYLSYFTL